MKHIQRISLFVASLSLSLGLFGCRDFMARFQGLRYRQSLIDRIDQRFTPIDCVTFDLPTDLPDPICGYVTVPELHTQATTNLLELPVVIIPSRNSSPAPDPLVIAQGGPGASTLDAFAPTLVTGGAIADFLDQRDIVLIDQRGTPRAQPSLACPGMELTLRDLLRQGLLDDATTTRRSLQATLAECVTTLESQGVNFRSYTSEQNALDMITVLDSLGYDQVNFYGVSYGSLLAQFLLRQAPDRLRSVILDAVVPTHVNVDDWIPESGSRALRQVFAACLLDEQCHRRYPNLEQSFFNLVDRLNANPVEVAVQEGTQTLDIPVDGNTLLILIYQNLYASGFGEVLPRRITEMVESQDYKWLSPLLQQAMASPLAEGMFQSVRCAQNNYPTETPATIPAFFDPPFPPVETALTGINPLYCDLFNVAPLPAEVYDPVTADVPTLVMNGQFDPITPLIFGTLVANTLPNSYVYHYPGAGHGSLVAGACPVEMVEAFLADPTQAPSDACIQEMTVGFTYAPTPIAELRLKPVTIQNQFRTVVPEQWQETLAPDTIATTFSDPNDAGNAETGRLTFWTVERSQLPTVIEDLGLTSTQIVSEAMAIGTMEWTIYQIDLISPTEGTERVAIATANDKAYVVELTASPETVQPVFEALWQPVLENFTLVQ